MTRTKRKLTDKWLNRHGFTNGLWRFDERDLGRKMAQYRRNVVAGWPDWRNVGRRKGGRP